MNRIEKAFGGGKAFIGFLTAGDPSIDKSEEFILELVRGGVDLIEIGIPFSDPVAEGPVIQGANIRALSGGVTTDQVFALVGRLRKKTDVAIVFLTYLNPVFRYGYEAFFARCQSEEVDGILIPDLPFEEKEEVHGVAKRYGIKLISMLAPTSGGRIQSIVNEAEGFLYVVSSMGVTGIRSEISKEIDKILFDIKKLSKIPVAVGFGINNKEQAKYFSERADGIIIGSAIVKIIEEYGEYANSKLYEYAREIKAAIKNMN